METEPRIGVVFFKTPGGVEPVRDWLKALPVEDRRTIGLDLMRVQVGWPIGMPLRRSLGSGLWEVRSTLPSRRIARLLFVAASDRIFLLHGFIKKSQATPTADLALARRRAKEMSR